MAARRVAIDELAGRGSQLYWVESQPWTGRRHVAMWSPTTGYVGSDVAVDSSLHAYGGGLYTLADDGRVWSASDDGAVRDLDGAAASTLMGVGGDLAWGAGRLWLVCDLGDSDQLVVVNPATGGQTVVLHDAFLGAPRPAGDRLAWLRWPSDAMPWDSCEVWAAGLDADHHLVSPIRVAGGYGESALQPTWGPDGWLYFVSDRSGWWNLYRWREGPVEAVAPMAAECAVAPWEAGYRSFTFLPDGRLATLVQHGPDHQLVVAEGGAVAQVPMPFTSVKPYLAACGDRLAVIGSTPTQRQQIAVLSVDGSSPVEVIREVPADSLDGFEIAVPQRVEVAASGGQIVAFVYRSAGVAGATPVIVRVHPGPTHHSELRLDWEVQFFTSRGYTVVDVDYRGSTGYGRAFRAALDHAWGEVDVADCVSVARHLLADGTARPGAVFIAGSSAGGYTAIRAVCDPSSPFVLAVARSAIIDPNRWVQTAPRFQRPHAMTLTHPGAGIEAHRVCRPVLLVHGTTDPIAPVEDAVSLAGTLRSRGLLAGLVIVDGGHYLGGLDLIRALESELAAYQSVLSPSTRASGTVAG